MLALIHTLLSTEISPGNLPHGLTDNNGSSLKLILNIVWSIVGALALLMITVSGFRYVLSSGDPQKAAQARNGIIYALVGLALAISAVAIVNATVGRI